MPPYIAKEAPSDWIKFTSALGRAKEKYLSVARYYNIEVPSDEKNHNATEISWQKNLVKYEAKIESLDIYFLRTNMNVINEVVVWDIYNTIL